MKVIIAGSRGCNDYELLKQVINDSNFNIGEIISGGAIGVDRLGERYAHDNNIILHIMYANWGEDGRKAGILRNIKMADYSDALIYI